MGSKTLKGKTAKKRTLWLSVGAALCGVAIALASLFGGIGSMNANAMYDGNYGDYITLMSDDTTFSGDALSSLYDAILPAGYDSTYEGLKSYLYKVSNGDPTKKGITSQQIHGNNGSKDIVVDFGGKKWTVTYVSESKSGDLLATLWLANSDEMGNYEYSRFSAKGWYNEWDQTSYNLQCNIYGSSYIRAVTLNAGTSFSLSDTNSSAAAPYMQNVGQNKSHPLYRFTMVNSDYTGVTDSLTQFIERPLNVAWQEDENYCVDVDTNSYTMGNEAYGVPKGAEKWWVGARSSTDEKDYYKPEFAGKNYGTDRGAPGATNYASRTEPSGYHHYRDMKYAYTGKAQYNDWANDYVWLPSVSETGWSSDDFPKSIWKTSANQRQNVKSGSDGHPAADCDHPVSDLYETYTGTVYDRTWLRSGGINRTNSDYALSSGGAGSIGGGNNWFSVRPALHLNLNSAALSAAQSTKVSVPKVENPDDGTTNTVTVKYNQSVQGINILNVDPDFVTATVKHTNESGVESGTLPANTTLSADLGRLTAKAAGTYTVTFTPKNGAKWADGSTDATKTVIFKITSQELAIVWDGGPYTYDGTAHAPTATVTYSDGTPVTPITYKYYTNKADGTKDDSTATTTAPTAAGSYTVEAVFDENVAEGYSVGKKYIAYTINKRKISVEAGSITFPTREYDGTTAAGTPNLNALAFNNIVEADKGNLSVANATAGTAGNAAFTSADAGNNQIKWNIKLQDKAGATVAKNYELETTEYTTYGVITPKKVTVSGITFADKVYDGTTNATANLTGATVSGLVGSETLTVAVENAKYTSADVNLNTADGTVLARPVNFTPVIKDGTGANAGKASNYVIDFGNASTQTTYATSKITQKEVDVTLSAQTGVKYGEVPAVSYTVTQVDSSTGENVLIKLTYSLGGTGTPVDQPKAAGEYTINAAMHTGFTNNYKVRQKLGDTTVTVAKAPLTLTADSATIAYGDAVPTLTFAVSGLKYTDTAATLLSGWVAKTSYVNGTSPAGSYDVKIYESSSATTAVDNNKELDNYTITVENGTLKVTGAQIIVELGDKTKVYDGAAVTGVPSDVTYTIKNADGTANTTITTLAQLGYKLSFEDGVTVQNAGKYVITAKKTGTEGNYVVEVKNGVYEITKAALTITAKNKTVSYGDAPANDGVEYTGLVANDKGSDGTIKDGVLTGTLGYTYNYTQYTAVGSYRIAVGGVTAANYEITFADGTLTVSPKAVKVQVNAQSSVYGSAVNLNANDYTLTDGALARAEDSLLLTLGTTVTATSGAGNYDFTAKAGNANYAVTFVSAAGELTADADGKVTYTNGYTVKKAPLTVTFRNDYIANGETPDVANFDESRVDVKGLVNGEQTSVLSGKLSFTSTTLSDGTGFEITVAFKSGETLSNYEVTFEKGKLTSSAVILVVKIGDLSITYGETAKTLTDFTVTITDNNGAASSLSLDDLGYELKFVETDVTNAGRYTVTAVAKSGGATAGYNVRIQDGVYTVNKFKTTVTVKDITSGFAYGDDPAAIYNDLASLDLTAADALTTLSKYISVKDNKLAGSETLAVLGIPQIKVVGYQQYLNAGTYANALMLSGFKKDGADYSNPNYELTFVNGSLTVAKRDVTITLDAGLNSEYKAELNVNYAVKHGSDEGLVNGDSLGLKFKLGTAVTGNASAKVGKFALAVDGGYNANYNVTNLNALDSYQYEITKRALTVKANDISAVYGATPVATGYEIVSGKLYDGETLDETALAYEFYKNDKTTTVADTFKFETGGEYYLKAKGLSGEVYEITYDFGTLTITGAKLTVVVTVDENAEYGKKYTAPDALVTATFTGVATGDDVKPVFTYYKGNTSLGDGVVPTAAGDYSVVVTLGGTDGGKYSLEANRTTLHIAKKALTITAPDATISYGDDLPDTSAYEYKCTGLAESDTDASGKINAGVLGGTAVYGFTYVKFGGVGEYAVTVSGLTADNYDITFASGKLTVKERAVTVKLTAQSGVYGDTPTLNNSAYEFYKDGAKLGDSTHVGDNALARATDDLGIVITTDAVATSAVGNYKLIATYGNANYKVTFDGATENSGSYEVANAYAVQKAELTVTVKDGTFAKGDAPEVADFTADSLTVSGLKNSDDAATVLGGTGVLTFTVTDSSSGAGTQYTVSVTVATLANYNVTANSGTWNIVEADLTIKIEDKSVTYKGEAYAVSDVTYKILNADGTESSVTLAQLGYELKFESEAKNAGRYTVTAQPVAAGATAGYKVVVSRGVFTVEKKAITVKAKAQTLTYGDEVSKVYADFDSLDLSTDADALSKLVTYIELDSTTLLAGTEKLTVLGKPSLKVIGYAQYGDVGAYNGVLVISGFTNANYEYTYVNGDLTVAKRTLKVGMTEADKATLTSDYGKPLSTVTFTVYESDIATPWTAGSALGAKIEVIGSDGNALDIGAKHNAGKYSIKFNQDNLSGNYTLDESSVNTLVNGINNSTDKYTIKKAAITIKAADGNIGVGDAVDTAKGFGVKIVSGTAYEDASVIFATDGALTFAFGGYTQTSPTGTYDITVTVDNTKVDNYEVTVASDADGKGKLNVSGANTVTVKLDVTKLTSVYGDAVLTNEQIIAASTVASGAASNVADLELVFEIKAATEGGAVKDAGTYDVVLKSYKDGLPYAVTLDRVYTYTITKKPITLVAKQQTITYGDDPATLFDGADFTNNLADYVELKSGSAFATGESLATLDSTGVSLYVSGYKQYGDVKDGGYANVIMLGGITSDNYDITFESGTLVVNKREVKVAIDGDSLTSVYGEDVNITYKTYLKDTTVSAGTEEDGLVDGDKLGLVIVLGDPTATLAAGVTVGTYYIKSDITALNGNYSIEESALNTEVSKYTYSITAKKVTITAESKTITYGDAVYSGAQYGYTVEGLVDGEDATVLTGTLAFTVGGNALASNTKLNANEHDVVPAGLTGANYEVEYVNGKLTVLAKEITVTVKRDGTKAYDGNNVTLPTDSNYFTVAAGSLVSGDDESSLGLTLEVLNNGSNVDVYSVVYKTHTNNNYKLNVINGTYKITAKQIYVQWIGANGSADATVDGKDNFSWVYNVTATAAATEQGPSVKFYDGKDFSTANAVTLTATVIGKQINVGTGYSASIQLPAGGNYVLASDAALTKTFQITPAELTVKWKKDASSGELADLTNIVYNYNSSKVQSPIPVLYLGSVDVTAKVTYSLSGRTQEIGDHQVRLELGANYVVKTGATASSVVTCNYKIVGTQLSGFHWAYQSGTVIGDSFIGGDNVQKVVYNGETQQLIATTTTSGAEIKYEITDKDGNPVSECKEAGVYKIKVVVDGYSVPEALEYANFEITKAKVSITWDTTSFSYDYDGNAHKPVASFVAVDGSSKNLEMAYTDSSNLTAACVNAGTYTATASLSVTDAVNYEFIGASNARRTFTVRPATIAVQWGFLDKDGTQVDPQPTPGTDGTYSLNFNNKEQTLSWMAQMNGTQVEKDGLKFVYTLEKDGVKVYETADEPNFKIKDVGTYTISLSVKSETLSTDNYTLSGATQTVKVEPAELTITVSQLTGKEINYGDEIAFSGDKQNFKVEVTGLQSGDTLESLGLVDSDGNYWWLTTGYTNTANPGSKWTIDLVQNASAVSNFKNILKNYKVQLPEAGADGRYTFCEFSVNTKSGEVIVVGENTNVPYFVYDGTSKKPQAYYYNAQNAKVELEVQLSEVTSAVNVGTYKIKVTKPYGVDDGIDLTDNEGNITDTFEFEIRKIVLVVEITNQNGTYGDIVVSGDANGIVQWQYGVYAPYNMQCAPLPGDEQGLGIKVTCNFTVDAGNFATCGKYEVICSWNDAEAAGYSKNYDVLFCDETNHELDATHKVYFTVDPAKITVSSRGEELFDEELRYEPQGKRIGLANKTEDGKSYEYITFKGLQDISDVSVKFEDRFYDLSDPSDVADLENGSDINYTATSLKIGAIGKYAARYQITKPNHEPLEGIWRVIVLKASDAIIVLFQNEFEVDYGEGIPADFLDKLFGTNAEGEEYFTLSPDGAVTDKEEFREMVERAYVYGASQDSSVGYSSIYFDLKEGLGSLTSEYSIIYREIGNINDKGTNQNKFKISPRELEIDWGLVSDTFQFDENAHKPTPTIRGWRDGGELKLTTAVNGQKYYYVDSNGERITVSVEINGDFTSVGQDSYVKLTVDNLNYAFTGNNAEEEFRVKILSGTVTPVEPTSNAGLPLWAYILIAGVALILLVTAIALGIALKKRKAVAVAGDDDGFYDDASDDDDGFNDIFKE